MIRSYQTATTFGAMHTSDFSDMLGAVYYHLQHLGEPLSEARFGFDRSVATLVAKSTRREAVSSLLLMSRLEALKGDYQKQFDLVIKALDLDPDSFPGLLSLDRSVSNLMNRFLSRRNSTPTIDRFSSLGELHSLHADLEISRKILLKEKDYFGEEERQAEREPVNRLGAATTLDERRRRIILSHVNYFLSIVSFELGMLGDNNFRQRAPILGREALALCNAATRYGDHYRDFEVADDTDALINHSVSGPHFPFVLKSIIEKELRFQDYITRNNGLSPDELAYLMVKRTPAGSPLSFINSRPDELGPNADKQPLYILFDLDNCVTPGTFELHTRAWEATLIRLMEERYGELSASYIKQLNLGSKDANNAFRVIHELPPEPECAEILSNILENVYGIEVRPDFLIQRRMEWLDEYARVNEHAIIADHGMAQVMQFCAENELKMGVVTNANKAYAVWALKQVGLWRFYKKEAPIVGADDAPSDRRKPHFLHWDIGLRLLGYESGKGKVLLCEDSPANLTQALQSLRNAHGVFISNVNSTRPRFTRLDLVSATFGNPLIHVHDGMGLLTYLQQVFVHPY